MAFSQAYSSNNHLKVELDHRLKLAISPRVRNSPRQQRLETELQGKRKSWDSPRRSPGPRNRRFDYTLSLRLTKSANDAATEYLRDSHIRTIEKNLDEDERDWSDGLRIASKSQIVAGFVEKLLSHLFDVKEQDTSYIDEFLYAYRKFMTSEDLLEFLFKRYLFLPEPNTPTKETIIWAKYLPLIQYRVVTIVKKWMLEHFYDFERNQQLLQAMHGFIENIIRPTQSSEKWYSTLKVIIHQQAKFEGPLDICLEDDVSIAVFKAVAGREDSGIRITHTKKGKSHYRCFMGMHIVDWLIKNVKGVTSIEAAIQMGDVLLSKEIIIPHERKKRDEKSFQCGKTLYRFKTEPPCAEVPVSLAADGPVARRDNHPLTIFSACPVHLAQQLTFYSTSLYRQMRCRNVDELSGLLDYIQRWNTVMNWIVSEVARCEPIGQRAEAIKQILKICNALFELNNFFDLSAIITGLNHTTLAQLTSTWKSISKDWRKKLDSFSLLVSPDNSYKNLREAMLSARDTQKFLVPHVVPYYLDLDHLKKVPDRLVDGMINWHKIRVKYAIVTEMTSYGRVAHNIAPIPEYQEFIAGMPMSKRTERCSFSPPFLAFSYVPSVTLGQ